MARLETSFLGMNLSSPIIVGSSGLTGKPEQIAELADAGAGAVVLKSLFEEQILASIARETKKGGVVYGHAEVDDYVGFYERKHSIDEYMNLIAAAKKAASIPVVASINATSSREWQGICADVADAGADALQLNLFVDPFDPERTSEEIEATHYDIVRKVNDVVTLPIAVKVGPSFTNVGRLVAGLAEAGAQAVVLFNRYASPDIDVRSRVLTAGQPNTGPTDYLPALRWTALLSRSADVPLIGATGIHDGATAVKFLLAGARAVEVVSTVYKNKKSRISQMNADITAWMDENSCATIDEFRGSVARQPGEPRNALERVQYMKQFGDV